MYITKHGLDFKGEAIDVKTDFSITAAALEEKIKAYSEDFGHQPEALSGSLAESNMRNFQIEFHKARVAHPSAGRAAWAQMAIKNISFGRERVKKGYTDFEVTLGANTLVDLGDEFGSQLVPETVPQVVAKKGSRGG